MITVIDAMNGMGQDWECAEVLRKEVHRLRADLAAAEQRTAKINAYARDIAEECMPIEDALDPVLTREEWDIYHGESAGELPPDRLAIAEAWAATINSACWSYGILDTTDEGKEVWRQIKEERTTPKVARHTVATAERRVEELTDLLREAHGYLNTGLGIYDDITDAIGSEPVRRE